MIYVKLLITATIITYIWEISGFIFDIAKWVHVKTKPEIPYMGQPLRKPFGCYSCIIFWVVTIMASLEMGILLGLLLATVASLVAPYIKKLLKFIEKHGN